MFTITENAWKVTTALKCEPNQKPHRIFVKYNAIHKARNHLHMNQYEYVWIDFVLADEAHIRRMKPPIHFGARV